MAEKKLFRQAALDRLSSPEQLDRLMQVTSPRGWIALSGFCLAILFALLWSIFGRIPTTVTGSGILMSSAGIREIEVVGSGVVADLNVTVGDFVMEGQLIASVGQPQLLQQVSQARDRVALLQEERDRRLSFTETNVELETETLDRERDDFRRQIEAIDDRITWLENRRGAEQEALALGLITNETVQGTIQLLEAARGNRVGLGLQLQNNELRRLLLDNRANESLEDIDRRIRDAENQLQAVQLQLEQASNVVSPYSGYVQEVRTDVGQLIVGGSAIISVEMTDAPLQAVIFVPSQGKLVRAGMTAQISPVTVKREEFGFMLGEVSFVSGQPATPAGMLRTLGNPILVEQVARQGAPFLVRVDPLIDSTNVSGFRWSSPRGPPVEVESGTECSVRLVVEERRPISLILPIFRSALGLAA